MLNLILYLILNAILLNKILNVLLNGILIMPCTEKTDEMITVPILVHKIISKCVFS